MNLHCEGAQLAVDVINKNGGILGKQVVLKNMDGKSDPVTVGNAAKATYPGRCNRCYRTERFRFWRAGESGSANCWVGKLHPQLLHRSMVLTHLAIKLSPLSMWNTTMGATTAEFAYNDKGWRKGYVVTDDFIDYTKSLSRYFIVRFEKWAGKSFEDTYTQGQQDFLLNWQESKRLKKNLISFHLILYARSGSYDSNTA